MSDLARRLATAQAAVKGLRDRPDNDTLLERYS